MELEVQRLERRREDAVNSELDLDRPVIRLDMDVARPSLQRVQDNRIHELDDRALVLRDLFDGQDLVAPLVLLEQQRAVIRLEIFQRLAGFLAPAQCGRNRLARADHPLQGALQ